MIVDVRAQRAPGEDPQLLGRLWDDGGEARWDEALAPLVESVLIRHDLTAADGVKVLKTCVAVLSNPPYLWAEINPWAALDTGP